MCDAHFVWNPPTLRYPAAANARRQSRRLSAMRGRNAWQVCTAMAADNGAAALPRPKYIPNKIDDPNYVRIFDTTLRDGEQSPGATLTRCVACLCPLLLGWKGSQPSHVDNGMSKEHLL